MRLPRSRRWAAAAGLALVAAVIVTLLLLRPASPQHIVLLATTTQDDPTLRPTSRGANAATRPVLFGQIPDSPSLATARQRLAGLTQLPAHADLIVVLQGHAGLTYDGELAWLPKDAAAEEPVTWLPVGEVLEAMQACPARGHLLVLDMLTPAGQAAAIDIGELARQALDAAPDPRRLALICCAPGQVPQQSPLTGGSVFAFYLQERLVAGAVDRARIDIHDLVAAIAPRVERWTLGNHGVRQTPVLHGAGRGFALLPRPSVATEAEAAPDAAAQSLPVFTAAARRPVKPASFPRLAYSLAFRPATSGQDRDAGAALTRQLAEAHAQWSAAPPEQTEAMKLRGLEALAEAARSVSPGERAAAVHAWLMQSKLDPASVRWADAVLRRLGDAEPRYVETLTVRLLADWADRIPASDWPAPVAHQVLTLAALSHARFDPELFPWMRDDLEAAFQKRHEGEIALWCDGYAPRGSGERLLHEAEAELRRCEERLAPVRATLAIVESAARLLPAYVPYLEWDARQEPLWGEAVMHTAELRRRWSSPPRAEAGRNKMAVSLLGEAKQLEDRLAVLRAALTAPAARLEAGDASPAVLGQLRTLAAMPDGWVSAEARSRAAGAAGALAERFHEATRQLDAQDDASAFEPAPERDPRALRLRRARIEPALWRLAGAEEDALERLRAALRRVEQDPARTAAWTAWHKVLRDTKLKLGRADAGAEAWTWLAQHYRYQADDYEHLGLTTPGMLTAQRFYADAAGAHPSAAALSRASVREIEPVPRLHAGRQRAVCNLELTRVLPPGRHGVTELRVLLADERWLEVTPGSIELPGLVSDGGARTLATSMPLHLTLAAAAEQSQTPRPLGFLAQARLGGRAFHRIVHVPLDVAPQEVEIFLSSNPQTPEPRLDTIALRPGGVRQAFFLHVHNLTPRQRRVIVELRGGGLLVPGGRAAVTLAPGALERVRLGEGALAQQPLPEFHGPLEVRLLDADKNARLLVGRTFPVEVLSPRSYVRIADAQVEPPRPDAPGNRFTVQLAARGGAVRGGAVRGSAAHSPIPARLVLPYRRVPGLGVAEGGISERELPPGGDEKIKLSADKIRWSGPPDAECPIYLTVDGVPRAFVFRTRLGAFGVEPELDDRLALRIGAPACTLPAAELPVTLEVDNAPAESRVELSVQHPGHERDVFVLTRRFAGARAERLGLLAQGPDGALVFEASISDWQVLLDTTNWRGRHVLKARLVDPQGRELQHSLHELIVDDTPPEETRFVAPPLQAQKGVSLKLEARGRDPESDIVAVHFFVGEPADGKAPARAETVPATLHVRRGVWTALVPLPESAGRTPVSVQFTNRVGLTRTATTTLELLDVDPTSLRPGAILGKVFEGPRPQPNLVVVLQDAAGNEQAQIRTQTDGSFRFEALLPGDYQLLCVKPESGRRALLPVTVEPGATQRVNLALAL